MYMGTTASLTISNDWHCSLNCSWDAVAPHHFLCIKSFYIVWHCSRCSSSERLLPSGVYCRHCLCMFLLKFVRFVKCYPIICLLVECLTLLPLQQQCEVVALSSPQCHSRSACSLGRSPLPTLHTCPALYTFPVGAISLPRLALTVLFMFSMTSI